MGIKGNTPEGETSLRGIFKKCKHKASPVCVLCKSNLKLCDCVYEDGESVPTCKHCNGSGWVKSFAGEDTGSKRT